MEGADLLAKTIIRFVPDQAGVLWIGILLVFFVAGDLRQIFSRRNAILAVLLLPAIPLLDIMLWEGRLGSSRGWLLGAAFSGLFALTAFSAAFALYLALRKPNLDWNINLPNQGLRVLLVIIIIINTLVVLGRPADDAGNFTSFGAQRWLETGTMPYGDPLLRGPDAPGYGAAATYGPLLYVAHMPFQLLSGLPSNNPDVRPIDKEYKRPAGHVTQLTCLVFQLLAIYALFELGRRHAGESIGLAMAILYAGSPYVMGLGSDDGELITGLPFISHIAPAAMILLALLFLERPFISGLMLAGGVGVLFWPAFLFPLFLGWYFWQQRDGVVRFTAGFVSAGVAIAVMVIYFTGSIGDQGPIDLLLTSTLEHQEGVGQREYGASKFSFWGTHPKLAAFWQQPIIGNTSILKPTFIVFSMLCALSFMLVRGKEKAQFALLIAFLAAAIQLWKTHAGGTYVEWYLPFLITGILLSRSVTEQKPSPAPVG